MTTTPAANSASPSTSSNHDHDSSPPHHIQDADPHNGASSASSTSSASSSASTSSSTTETDQMSVDPPPYQSSSEKQQSPLQHHQQQQQLQQQQNKHQPQQQHQPPSQSERQHQQQQPPRLSLSSPSSSPPQQQQQQSSKQQQQQQTNPTNIEQKRPMNAFLLYCKKQRSLVREKHPNLENRGITKILGDWWSKLDKEQKSKYKDLARQHKEAFMEANPDFKWCRTPIVANNSNGTTSNSSSTSTSSSGASGNNNNSTSNSSQHTTTLTNNKTTHHGSSPVSMSGSPHAATNGHATFSTNHRQLNEAPKPPKKRYLERNEPVYSKNHLAKNDDANSDDTDDRNAPYMQLIRQSDLIGRAVEKALSEKSNDSPTGLNMCKDSNRNHFSNNLTQSICIEPNPFTTSTTTTATSAPTSYTTTSTSASFSNGDDKPVDLSSKQIVRTNNQKIINTVIDQAFLDDDSSGTSRLGAQSRRVNAKET